jgi:hypothetical protein
VATQPGTVGAEECVPINGNLLCALDLTGPAFQGDSKMHQALDDNVQGTQWKMVITNTGAAQGSYTVTVVDRPS